MIKHNKKKYTLRGIICLYFFSWVIISSFAQGVSQPSIKGGPGDLFMETYEKFNEVEQEKSQLSLFIKKDEKDEGRELQLDSYYQNKDKKEGNRSKFLLVFYAPKNIQETKLLNYSQKNGQDDQWFYAPAFKSTRRIIGKGQQASFMGSEFTFEDLSGGERTKFHFEVLKEDNVTIELKRTLSNLEDQENSSYAYVILKIDKSLMQIRESIYFKEKENEKGQKFFQPIKTATFIEFKEFKELKNVQQKTIYRPMSAIMKNEITGAKSEFRWHQRVLSASSEFEENFFSPHSLSRALTLK